MRNGAQDAAFFNSIAEDWDELNREVLGDFRLPEAVREAVPDGCGIAVVLGCRHRRGAGTSARRQS